QSQPARRTARRVHVAGGQRCWCRFSSRGTSGRLERSQHLVVPTLFGHVVTAEDQQVVADVGVDRTRALGADRIDLRPGSCRRRSVVTGSPLSALGWLHPIEPVSVFTLQGFQPLVAPAPCCSAL